MPLPSLPVHGLDDINHRRRSRETINNILNHQFDDSKVRTKAEILAGVTPVNYAYVPGDIRRYGGVGDGTTNNDGPLAQLLLVMKQGVDGYIPLGTFSYTTSPNWAWDGITLRGERGTILKHTGSGIAFNVDAGGSGNRKDGLQFSYLIIQGNANTTDAFYTRGILRSTFEFIEVRGACTGKAFFIGWGIANIYSHVIISFNLASITTVPLHGFYLDTDGTAGNYTTNCEFINLVAEGLTGNNGLTLHDATGNLFIGGTSEANGIGIDIDNDNCRRNRFVDFWCEGNTTSDVRVKGVNNSFSDCYFNSASASPSVDISTGSGTIFVGGFERVVNLQATSRNTLFVGAAFSDNPALGITGTGTYKLIGGVLEDSNLNISATMQDALGETGNFTPTVLGSVTAGTTTYTTQQGYYHRIGDQVQFQLRVGWSAQTGAGSLLVGGLPYASKNTNSQPVSILVDSLTFAGQVSAAVSPNTTRIEIFSMATGVAIANVPLDTAASVWISGSYFV